jgi:hypothetical protein|tara:strand:+ start:43 stop:495 length:453 start_codon:yes stop_codon:yes gene_type:complete
MNKIIITLLAFLFFTNCGYTPIYSNKNFNLYLERIDSTKNTPLNSKIKKRLQIFSNQESKKVISLTVDAQKETNILAKNSKGDPSRYEMIININLKTAYGQNQNITKSFQERFNYNSNINKFELNQYEKEIEDLLINKNIDRIIVYLSKI